MPSFIIHQRIFLAVGNVYPFANVRLDMYVGCRSHRPPLTSEEYRVTGTVMAAVDEIMQQRNLAHT